VDDWTALLDFQALVVHDDALISKGMQAKIIALLIVVPALAHADESVTTTESPPTLRLSAEVDPADYTVYSGWGGFVGIHPEATGPWRFRIGGGAASLPDAVVQNNDTNQGWHERIDLVFTVAAHRYFGHDRGGFFVGPVAGWSTIKFTAPGGGTVDVRNVFAGFDIGYRWFPSKNLGLVITPHLGAIVPLYKSHEPEVGGMKYDLLPVMPMPQLLIGYEMDVLK
jgi:hypothetical protein